MNSLMPSITPRIRLALASYVFYVVELLIHGIMHRGHHHGSASEPTQSDLQTVDVSAASSESLSKIDPNSAILPTKIARRSIASLHGQATTSEDAAIEREWDALCIGSRYWMDDYHR